MYLDNPTQFLGKSGLLLAMMKCLKKRLNVQNRESIFSVLIEILT
jgi:hypothetical protein